MSKLGSPFGYPKYLVPYYTKDQKGTLILTTTLVYIYISGYTQRHANIEIYVYIVTFLSTCIPTHTHSKVHMHTYACMCTTLRRRASTRRLPSPQTLCQTTYLLSLATRKSLSNAEGHMAQCLQKAGKPSVLGIHAAVSTASKPQSLYVRGI